VLRAFQAQALDGFEAFAASHRGQRKRCALLRSRRAARGGDCGIPGMRVASGKTENKSSEDCSERVPAEKKPWHTFSYCLTTLR
jgi:hypothetical protein